VHPRRYSTTANEYEFRKTGRGSGVFWHSPDGPGGVVSCLNRLQEVPCGARVGPEPAAVNALGSRLAWHQHTLAVRYAVFQTEPAVTRPDRECSAKGASRNKFPESP